MTVSDVGRKMTQDFEGMSLNAYKDVAGVWTIGIGHIQGVKEGMTVTLDEAIALYNLDAKMVENALNKMIPPDCTQNQFDALVDFGFNLGIGALQQLLAHPWNEIPDWLPKWNKARVEGVLQPVKGLTRRREAERDLFLSQPALDATS